MSDANPPDEPGFSMGDLFADTPLFREIQRVLMSSRGPVNWELARQVGIYTATMGGQDDPSPSEGDRRSFEDAVRVAELQVSQYTGLAPPTDVAPVEAVRRGQWVQRNVEGLRELIDPAAERIGRAMSSAIRLPEGGEGAPLGADMLGQLSPLLLGAQVGSVFGYLAQRVLGQYDIAVPRPQPGSLFFVVPNIAAFERDWSLPPTDFRTWVALHEVTHRFEFARPWAREHFRTLLGDFLATLELDFSGIEERIARLGSFDPTSADPEALEELFASEEGLFGAVLDEEQRLKLNRIQAFMSAAEGYGDHVTHAIGRSLLPSYPQIEEAMRRYRETEHGDPVFERLLGIEMKREQYRLGKAFCDTVVERTDEATLGRMWDSAEAVPSLPELEEPTLWLSRIA